MGARPLDGACHYLAPIGAVSSAQKTRPPGKITNS
jgi:hypothetical protein